VLLTKPPHRLHSDRQEHRQSHPLTTFSAVSFAKLECCLIFAPVLIPTFAAAGGNPDIVAQCLRGSQIGERTFKVHLDGHNLIPFFKGETKQSPRRDFLYWNDDGELVAVRVLDWKIVFKEQEHKGIGVWQGGFTDLRIPKLFNLRSDPFERGDESILYDKWMVDRVFVQVPAQALVANWLQSFHEFPIRQKPASFTLDAVMARLSPTKD
jgi:hypothetical protein